MSHPSPPPPQLPRPGAPHARAARALRQAQQDAPPCPLSQLAVDASYSTGDDGSYATQGTVTLLSEQSFGLPLSAVAVTLLPADGSSSLTINATCPDGGVPARAVDGSSGAQPRSGGSGGVSAVVAMRLVVPLASPPPSPAPPGLPSPCLAHAPLRLI
jgi:hypothetical protein